MIDYYSPFPPVPFLAVEHLSLEQAVKPSKKLGTITASLVTHRDCRASQWAAPTFEVVVPVKCKHGLREDWCAFCNGRIEPACVDARGTATSYQQRKKHKKDLTASNGVLYPSERIAQEGPDTVRPGADTLWNILPACELPAPVARFNQITNEDKDWAMKQSAFPRLRVSMAGRAHYERKLFANVTRWLEKDWREREEIKPRQRSARAYWKFCVAFEFPKVYDQGAMEAAAKHLLESCPREHLEALVANAAERGLLEGSFNVTEANDPSEVLSRKSRRNSNRHYVLGKRGDAKDDLTFVRQQDSNLVVEL
ncbi:MAG: hypothetical protein ACYDDS_19015 [Candidatus Sulfotelmatobacter sp.]